jgi:uncharacterized protein (TIGR02147 family)
MGKDDKINLFQYLDYREYLRDYYQFHKESRAGFSLRTFSKKAGFGSSNLLKLVMDGERNLTEDSLIKFMKGLGLNKKEQGFFRNLVHFNQAKSHDKKNYYYQKLLQSKHYCDLKPMAKEQHEFYSTWYHAIIRELITSDKYNGDLEKIAKKITPRISFKQIEKSVLLLEKIGFIKKTADNKWKVSDSLVTTGAECASITLLNYHKNILTLTKEQLERIPSDKRDISTLTLGVDKNLLPEIKKRIQNFRKEILELVSDQKNPSDVVLLAMQLMPLTKNWGDKK